MMTFKAWQIVDDAIAVDILDSPCGPIALRSWNEKGTTVPPHGSAVLLPIAPSYVMWEGAQVTIAVGSYAQVPGGALIRNGAGLIIHTPSYVGLPQAGGPVEPMGRLRYIDGCSDSLLVCPAKLGDPCLNLLHLPAGIHQTEHIHPSDRIGIILRGRGTCRTPDRDYELAPGMFWHIPTGGRHSFHTDDDSLDVFAWHPDSDFGPSHDWHPMLNRTIVDGVAANAPTHDEIRTAEIRE